MEKTLFIGNGLNRASESGASWEGLLNTLGGKPADELEKEIRREKPFTLWFEEISSRHSSRDLKKRIGTLLAKDVQPNKHHADVMALGIRNILTTNYDYNLEAASGRTWEPRNTARETYYSLFRRCSDGTRHVWHIHGELDNIGSIMLGHEQYTGYTHKIRNYLTTGVPTNVKNRKGRPYVSRFSRRKTKRGDDVETWVDLFLESEVHIVGFGFDYTENHLWSMLTEKRRLRRQGHDVGDVVFHRCATAEPTVAERARLSIFDALGVTVREYVAGNYSEAYEKCIDRLARSY